MLTIYQPINDRWLKPEEDNLVQLANPAHVGETVAFGGDRQWRVVEVEDYEGIAIAHVAPEGMVIPSRSKWTFEAMKADYPDLSIDVQIHDQTILGYGWSMEGRPTTGRLYEWRQIGDTDRGERVPLPWTVDHIKTYRPTSKGTYSAVHICHCKPVPEAVAA